MPRIRSVKPDWCQDEVLGRCSIGAQLLFLGLITQADDEGRQRGDPALLRALLWPYKPDVTEGDVERWLGELAGGELIVRYQAGGRPLVQLRTWSEHQVIRKPTPSRLAAPEGEWRLPAAPPGDQSQLSLAERYVTSASPVQHGREEEKEGNGIGDPPVVPPVGGTRFQYRLEDGESAQLAAGRQPGRRRPGRRARRSRVQGPAPLLVPQPCPLDALGDAAAEVSARWTPIDAELRKRVSDTTYELWLSTVHLHALDENGAMELGAPSETFAWVSDRYGKVLTTCADASDLTVVPCQAAMERAA